MRTAADVRSYFLNHWRQLVPDLLVPQARVGAAADHAIVQIDLARESAPVRRLVLVPLASGEPRLVRGHLARLRDLSRVPGTWAGLIVPHMDASGQRLCREAGIGFIDCCGNAYLRFNQIVVQIAGNRNRFQRPKRPRTLFHDKATIPLRILLEDPTAWVTTRAIADRGGLSLGWVSQILQRLDAERYVERKRGGGTRLIDPDRLVDEWLRHYSFEQNTVYPFRFRHDNPSAALTRLRHLGSPPPERYALTLDAAVALNARREPAAFHLYVPELTSGHEGTLDAWSETLGLRPAGLGANCFLIAPAYVHGAFFGTRLARNFRLVSDLQLYLDLYHYPVAWGPQARTSVAARLPFAVGEAAT